MFFGKRQEKGNIFHLLECHGRGVDLLDGSRLETVRQPAEELPVLQQGDQIVRTAVGVEILTGDILKSDET